MKTTDIIKNLSKMSKSELRMVCQEMKCNIGSKKEMITRLVAPLKGKYKFKMSSDDEEYIYSSSEDSDYLSESSNDDEIYDTPVNPVKKTKNVLNLTKIPSSYDAQFNALYMESLNADKTRRSPPYSREEIKDFLNKLKEIKNHHIIENAYEKFKRYIINWKTQGGYPEFPELFIANAFDEYNQKKKRSEGIINKIIRKYHKKSQQNKKLRAEKIRPTTREARARLFASRYGQ
jgi:hypothetical protein